MKLSPKRRFWNLYEDGVTQSFINMFQTCRLQTKLYYVDGWTSKKTPVWWHFGSCVHYVLSRSYAKPNPPIYSEICEYINAFATNNQSELQFDEDVQTLEQIYGFAEKVCYQYFNYYKSDFEHNWIYNESVFKIPYTPPNERQIYLTGRFDGGFRTKEGHFSLLDTKCLSQINIPNLIRILPVDTQVMFYSLASSILQQETPKQIYYNIIRRPMNKMTKKDEVSEVKVKSIDEKRSYTVYAEFETNGKVYKKGDSFSPPNDYQLDKAYMEFRASAISKGNAARGTAFVYEGEVINKETKERAVKQEILPIE